MTRPSRNIDQVLIATARELLPETGCRGFSIRQLTDRAGVNLGMFHYHFKKREEFLAHVLHEVYQEMFATLTFQAHADRPPVEHLRAALTVLGHFARDNRQLMRRLMADAMSDDPTAVEFFRRHFPLHLAVLAQLVVAGQQAGLLRKMPPLQAITFLASGIAMPNILATMFTSQGGLPAAMIERLNNDVLSDAAIAQRVDMAIRGLSTGK
ncbi:MAG: TetR/AcrR family transcriptional regulator [Deltaproteobacteria bacterium]|nr:TetR/AcrR family transcriptional regulator [Deltaproteobacteria bacterium]